MRRLAVLILAAGLAGCASLPKLHVGAGLSAVMPEDGASLENTYQVDGFARIDLAMMQIEASVGWKEYEYTDATGAQEGELSSIPIAVTFRHVTGAALFRFIVGGGLVWSVNDVTEVTAGNLSFENSAGFRAIGGVDMKIVEDFRLSAEVQYDFSTADIETTMGGGEPVNPGGLVVRAAVSYNF